MKRTTEYRKGRRVNLVSFSGFTGKSLDTLAHRPPQGICLIFYLFRNTILPEKRQLQSPESKKSVMFLCSMPS